MAINIVPGRARSVPAYKDQRYGTHLPILAKLILITDGPVLEIGAGKYSSPLIQGFRFMDRRIECVEENEEYRETLERGHLGEMASPIHEHWSTVAVAAPKGQPQIPLFDVILIDGTAPGRRDASIWAADKGLFVLMHDSEDSQYKYAFERYKYSHISKELSPETFVGSNYVDVGLYC